MFLDYDTFTEDPNYEIIYKPASVSYMVQRHYQNAMDDEYTTESELRSALTGSILDMADLAVEKSGFVAMWFDEPYVLASGSTIADIYYDRLYYLMNFDLDGGYGIEPIYARYGESVLVSSPQKPGYSFGGWTDPNSLNPDVVVKLPNAIPDRNTEYKAKWIPNPQANATVMIWGEDPNNPGTYEYMNSTPVKVAPGGTININNIKLLICNKKEHKHSAACCLIPEHTHGPECYYKDPVNDAVDDSVWRFPKNPKHGQISKGTLWFYEKKCIYDENQKKWYDMEGGPI